VEKHVHDFGRGICRVGDNGKCIRLSILKILKDAPDVVFEPFGQCRNILPREQRYQICRLWRITTEEFNCLFSLKHSRYLVTGQEDGHFSALGSKPLNQFPLRVRVSTIYFIQNKTHRHLVSSKEGRNTACVLAGLGETFNVRKTTELARCVQFEKVEPTGLCGCENQSGFSDTGWTVKKQALGVRGRLEIRLESGLDLGVSGDVLKDLGASGFAPHALSS
jgi:hypothetical protein